MREVLNSTGFHVYNILQIKKWLSDMRANKPAYIVIQHFIRSFRREASFLFHAKRKDRVSRSFLLHRKIYTSADTYFFLVVLSISTKNNFAGLVYNLNQASWLPAFVSEWFDFSKFTHTVENLI